MRILTHLGIGETDEAISSSQSVLVNLDSPIGQLSVVRVNPVFPYGNFARVLMAQARKNEASTFFLRIDFSEINVHAMDNLKIAAGFIRADLNTGSFHTDQSFDPTFFVIRSRVGSWGLDHLTQFHEMAAADLAFRSKMTALNPKGERGLFSLLLLDSKHNRIRKFAVRGPSGQVLVHRIF